MNKEKINPKDFMNFMSRFDHYNKEIREFKEFVLGTEPSREDYDKMREKDEKQADIIKDCFNRFKQDMDNFIAVLPVMQMAFSLIMIITKNKVKEDNLDA